MMNKTKLKPWSMLIYGVPKIGLSTLASQLPDPLFLNLDDNLDYLKPSKEITITCWSDFIKAGAEICEDRRPCTTIVICHIERPWSYVCDHVTKAPTEKMVHVPKISQNCPSRTGGRQLTCLKAN